jgi:hypothetical protein
MKPGYTDHGLVGADDDTFAFGPGKNAAANKTAQPPVPVIKTIEATAIPEKPSPQRLVIRASSAVAMLRPPQIEISTRAVEAKATPPSLSIAAQPSATMTEAVANSPMPPEAWKNTSAQRKELKTAAELASMIERDLMLHSDCPKTGLKVTVYGFTNWRAMLTIAPAAGRVSEPQKWRDLTDEFAERLRHRYDLT